MGQYPRPNQMENWQSQTFRLTFMVKLLENIIIFHLKSGARLATSLATVFPRKSRKMGNARRPSPGKG